MTMKKPPLADDVQPSWFKPEYFPLGYQPKIDGVRGMHLTGKFTGRSLDPFEGYGISKYFDDPKFEGIDGEMILGDNPKAGGNLCNVTHGAMSGWLGRSKMADLHWWAFDLLTPETWGIPYERRYELLARRVNQLKDPRLHLVPLFIALKPEDLDKAMDEFMNQGYEGLITRNLRAKAKEGRPNKGVWQIGRMKPWATAEMLVTKVIEGEKNNNPQTRNTLGKAERSSAKAGKVPNGMIGSLEGILLADLVHPWSKKVLMNKGREVTVSRGEMSASQASLWFTNQEAILDHIVTFQYMPHGMKDELRMATFKSKRMRQDMS